MLKEIVNAGIWGIGIYMPEKIRKNDFWGEEFVKNLPSHKIKDPFDGTIERRVFPSDINPSDIETEAGKRALEDAAVTPDEIDLVMVHSMLQDEIIPGNASLVQHKLGLKNAAAWNMDTCCSSFVTMVITASHLIAMKTFRKILIITSVPHSRMVDYADYLSVNVGDGAAGVVMGEVNNGKGYIGSYCCSNGAYHDAFTMKERMPLGQVKRHYEPSPVQPLLTINPETAREIGRHSNETMKNSLMQCLKRSNISSDMVDLFVSHQPCSWAHDVWRDSVGIPKEKSHQTYKIYGNLASTSIPVNLWEARKTGKLKDGDLVLMASSGAGENHSICTLRWGR